MTASLRARLVVSITLLGLYAPGAGAQHVEDLDSLRVWFGERLIPAFVSPGAAGFGDAGWAARAERARAQARAVTGTLTVLLIPALFADTPDPATAPDYLQDLFFGGASGPGTLSAFFDEASGGRLAATGDAAPWFRSSVTIADGTGGVGPGLGIGPAFGTYLLEALAAADQTIDFGQFDNDGPDGIPNSGDDNGTVDAVTFLFAEVARSCGGTGVWPHKSGVAGWNGGAPWASNDSTPAGTPVSVNGYVIISASECDGSPLGTVAVVAHELGHEIGLPDLYHPIGEGPDAILSINRRWVVGCFGLMAGGAWGCGPADQFPSFGPTHFSPWSRLRLGWAELTVVGEVLREEFVLAPVQASQQLLEIPLDRDGIESLLLEYRPQSGFDRELPASGVVAYRWNRVGTLRPNPAGPPNYLVSLLEANGDSTLLRTHLEGGNRGEAGDVLALDGGAVPLSNITHPSTRRADGSPSAVTVHSIEIVDGRARFVISTVDTPTVVVTTGLGTVPALASIDAVFPVSGGAQPYTVTLTGGTAPAGLGASVDVDRLLIAGTPLETGLFDVQVLVTDDRGVPGVTMLSLTVLPVMIPIADLVTGLVPGSSANLSADERELLDNDGNRNGGFDVGDLRVYWLRSTTSR